MSQFYEIFKILKKKKDNQIFNFFFKNEIRIFILLLSSTRFQDDTLKSIQWYIENIPSKTSSVINIKKQINLAVQHGYLSKKKSTIDKRSVIITSSEETSKVINTFLEEIKKI